MNNYIYYIILLISIFLSSYSQIILKKGAQKEHIYLNLYTIIGYFIMFTSTLFSLIAYKKVSLSSGQILQSLSFVFVTLLSYFKLKEKIKKRTIIGVIIIILGIIVFAM